VILLRFLLIYTITVTFRVSMAGIFGGQPASETNGPVSHFVCHAKPGRVVYVMNLPFGSETLCPTA
jgi:hypothetical protein